MLVCRQQAFVPASAQRVWELVGEPARHPEWWPEVLEVRGQRFGLGCSYCQVLQEDDGASERTFLVERVDELKELMVRCAENGLYMRWVLTQAQDGTFVDAEFGIDPEAAQEPPQLDEGAAKQQLRRWLDRSLAGLSDAASVAPPRADQPVGR
jgi:hypothetical protein